MNQRGSRRKEGKKKERETFQMPIAAPPVRW